MLKCMTPSWHSTHHNSDQT